jgi:hypothetical protein
MTSIINEKYFNFLKLPILHYQPPVQWVPESFSLGVKRPGRGADHSPPPNAEVKNAWSYTSTPQYVFMAWCLFKHRDNFTSYPTLIILCSLMLSKLHTYDYIFRHIYIYIYIYIHTHISDGTYTCTLQICSTLIVGFQKINGSDSYSEQTSFFTSFLWHSVT